jgi:hypothetical protein
VKDSKSRQPKIFYFLTKSFLFLFIFLSEREFSKRISLNIDVRVCVYTDDVYQKSKCNMEDAAADVDWIKRTAAADDIKADEDWMN